MEENHHNPLEIHRMPHTNLVELNKKRKLVDEQLAVPTRKHRFRDRDPSEHLSSYAGNLQRVLTTLIKEELVNGGEKVLDKHDSTGAMGKSVGTLAQSTWNKPADPRSTLSNTSTFDNPSTSSGSCGSNSPKNANNPSSSENVEEESPCTENKQQPGFEKHSEYGCYELENSEFEEFIDEEASMMLYSNGATSDMFLLSSGRWEVNAGVPVGTRMPTIDKEFEDYFSMMML